MKAYKFTNTDKTLEDLKNSAIYKAIEEAENTGKTNLLRELYKNSFGVDNLYNGYYLLQGWKFDTKKYCKRFLVRFKENWASNRGIYYEYYAPNKTTLYNSFYMCKSQIAEIIELENKYK